MDRIVQVAAVRRIHDWITTKRQSPHPHIHMKDTDHAKYSIRNGVTLNVGALHNKVEHVGITRLSGKVENVPTAFTVNGVNVRSLGQQQLDLKQQTMKIPGKAGPGGAGEEEEGEEGARRGRKRKKISNREKKEITIARLAWPTEVWRATVPRWSGWFSSSGCEYKSDRTIT